MFQFIAGVNSDGHAVKTPLPPATESEVMEYEKKINATLPDDYRAFLKTVNGGRIDTEEQHDVYACFKIYWSTKQTINAVDDYSEVGNLYTLNSAYKKSILGLGGEPFELYEALGAFRREGDLRIPSDTIPIGDDPGSNQILLGIHGENRGKVFYWFREGEKNEDDPNPPGYENVGFIANSFNEFLEKMNKCGQ